MELWDCIASAEAANSKEATHIEIRYMGNIRYFISLRSGARRRLASCLSSYSWRHAAFAKALQTCPTLGLTAANLGRLVKLRLDAGLDQYIRQWFVGEIYFNILVGTYGEKQKFILQCFPAEGDALYFKVGDGRTEAEMKAETGFLKRARAFRSFRIPEFVDSSRVGDWNVQVTREFHGKKVQPRLTPDIYRAFAEIADSGDVYEKDGVTYAFSHGDFAPWNIRRVGKEYLVFDWEYCGYRFYGYDLIHYVFQCETLLNKTSQGEALEKAAGELYRHGGRRYSVEKVAALYL